MVDAVISDEDFDPDDIEGSILRHVETHHKTFDEVLYVKHHYEEGGRHLVSCRVSNLRKIKSE